MEDLITMELCKYCRQVNKSSEIDLVLDETSRLWQIKSIITRDNIETDTGLAGWMEEDRENDECLNYR